MIQIKHPNLEQIAKNHYQAIINYLGKDKVASIDDKIQKKIDPNYTFKKIILAKPKELKKLAVNTNKRKKVFGTSYYSYLSQDKFKLGTKYYRGSDILKSLEIQVCPYCNRNFIYNLSGKRVNYQLDHFYSQTHYPFLSLSFYNLVPSCPTCNGLLQKKDKDVKVNPYDDTFPFDKIRFKLIILKPDFYYNIDGFKIEFDLSALDKEQKSDFESNIEVFSLIKHYKIHKDFILKLIQKNITYSESYLEELYTKFGGHIFKNMEELNNFVIENITTNFNVYPLAKLTKDISEELGLL